MALIIWIVLSAAMFALIPGTRAFILTYVLGILVLPVEAGGNGAIVYSQSLRIDKFTACHLGAMIGTLLFAHEAMQRYRPGWMEGVFALLVGTAFASSLVNGQGAHDGASHAMNLVRVYGPVLVLAWIHISTMEELYLCLRTLISGAFVYTVIAVAEFRLSPQLHRNVYGYFQHGFEQFFRYDYFRPVGMLRHAIELSSLFATTAIATLWLGLRRLFPPLWGMFPWPVVLEPC